MNLPGLPGMLPLAALGKGMPLGKGGMPLLNPAMAMAMMKGLPGRAYDPSGSRYAKKYVL